MLIPVTVYVATPPSDDVGFVNVADGAVVDVWPGAKECLKVKSPSQFVTFTVNPVAVFTGTENSGVNAAPFTLEPATVAVPDV
jgi:hypothetical protein